MINRTLGLTTDLYELTMAAAYFQAAIKNRAVFELYVRRLPPNRNYLVAAGLEQALDYLSNLKIGDAEIEFLRNHPAFKHVTEEFFDYLKKFRFTGDVWAIPEGTAVFGMEPLLRVEAPIIEAQVVETFLMSTISFQTLIASKASRVVAAAGGRSIVDFGTRRAHGTEAGLFAARAAYIGGCSGTSNVEAGHRFGIPTFGTVAHSFIMAFDDEMRALSSFYEMFPETATLLLDTYDTISAAKAVASLIGPGVRSVRLDSGDLVDLSCRVREILDQAGMQETQIFASGDMNEYRIADIVKRGGRIDGFGVGTEMVTSYDAPALNSVYKLVSLYEEGRESMRIKLSPEKLTYPGAKQVWRFTDDGGHASGDVIALAREGQPRGD
ncbi:MAG TPA: nicotinate phosphoribosyltransferase, partial [Blastocatellia bacterium]|nr:nicotinate phosphoribosyltransferase [Blastocatellia bacterium]